jgi:transcriptional regulator of acetoin/glycerol metabolism
MSAAAQFPMTRTADTVPRISLGPNAPAELSDFLAHAGIEVLHYAQKHHAQLYVDFVGASPGGVEVLSIDLAERGSRPARASAALVTDNWQAAACLIISRVLGFKPALLSADSATLSILKSAIGVAASAVPVIISGEIGSGKYNLARLIHSASRCRGGIFTMNCASLDDADLLSLEDLPEAGPRGSAAGAAIVYLDELAELSDAAQIKLVQFLQTVDRMPPAEVGHAGSLRIISATNRPLVHLVSRGELRRELYWRLNVFSLELPPLRDRVGDVAMLARYFLHRANPRRVFTPMALKILGNYSFPGNVLELESLVMRLAIAPLQTGHSLIDVVDVRRHLVVAPVAGEAQVSGWKSSREEARREMILRTIAAAGGNRGEAARRLGITTRALQYHITKAGLSRRRNAKCLARAAVTIAPAAPIFSSSEVFDSRPAADPEFSSELFAAESIPS